MAVRVDGHHRLAEVVDAHADRDADFQLVHHIRTQRAGVARQFLLNLANRRRDALAEFVQHHLGRGSRRRAGASSSRACWAATRPGVALAKNSCMATAGGSASVIISAAAPRGGSWSPAAV